MHARARLSTFATLLASVALLAPATIDAQYHYEGPLRSNERDWDADKAAHLLRRAGFGGTPKEIEHLVELGREGAVNFVLDGPEAVWHFPPPEIRPHVPPRMLRGRDLPEEERRQLQRFRRQNDRNMFMNLSHWWLHRMIETPHPLQEKMVLFWHGHFTSGMREVRNPWMLYEQNQLFRKESLGDFRTLLIEVSKNPAMLLYLDNARNIKQKPNENFARELLELFTLGEGHYTERDIKEAARAFTGWSIDRESGEFLYRARQHDSGAKTFMRERGRFGGEDIIDIILEQRAASEYLGSKLWTYFTGSLPSRKIEKAMGGTLRKHDYNIKKTLKRMFTSDAFYKSTRMHNDVKSPVELLVGTCRMLELDLKDTDAAIRVLGEMGQQPFQPPNVKGWDGGLKWINPNTLYVRYEFARAVLYGTKARKRKSAALPDVDGVAKSMLGELATEPTPNTDQPPFDPLPILRNYDLTTHKAVVEHFVTRLQIPLIEERKELLIDHLQKAVEKIDVDSRETAEAVVGLLHLIMSMVEYQVA